MADKVTVRARYESIDDLENALKKLKDRGMKHYEAYGPVNLQCLECLMPETGSAVRAWATFGAVLGLLSFWLMCVAASLIYHLVVGGKLPVSNVPFVVPIYEGTILFGSLLAFFSGVILAKLRPKRPPSNYDPRFSGDSFGVEVEAEANEEGQIVDLLKESGAVEIHGH